MSEQEQRLERRLALQKVKVNDIQVCYELHGEGFPLIMIMGLGGNMDWWDPRLIQGLSKKYNLVTFDNRGAGRSDVSDREYTVKLFADDTAGLMDALGISRANVLGISMGGMIAQELVLNFHERVEKLVLCSTTCGGPNSVQASPEVLEMLSAERGAFSAEEIARMTIPLVFTEEFIRSYPELTELSVQQILRAPISNEAFARQLTAIMKFDTYQRLSQIRSPTLVLHGKRDVLIPPKNGLILAQAIPNAKLVCFENSAHGLAEEMNKVILTLLNFFASENLA